jgi:hypothetical protein
MSDVKVQNEIIALRDKTPHIAVDFDGTLVDDREWRGVEWAGPPIQPVVARVKAALAMGWKVSIFTARVSPRISPEDGVWGDEDVAREFIERWCEEHIGQRLPVTAVKWGYFTEFWDDKAVAIVPNAGRGELLGTKKHWNLATEFCWKQRKEYGL